jgi:tRNA pseudouridine32 synthase/23S rRNA pseudouridine746 synthase
MQDKNPIEGSMRITVNKRIDADKQRAIDVLAEACAVSKAKLKDAMNKGAVLLLRQGKSTRLRRASSELLRGDTLQLCYDDDLLSRDVAAPELLADYRRYSIWRKPPGVLAQGNEWGDHCALTRLVELHFAHQRKVFVVHRFDREASGLMLLAHDAEASAKLGQLFQLKKIEKRYQIIVRGETPESGIIDSQLDGKAATTRYQRVRYDVDANTSHLLVQIDSGRKHQIRRHFASIDHPVMGDPQYGEHNRDERGLQLVAVQLAFICPLTRQPRCCQLPDQWRLFS